MSPVGVDGKIGVEGQIYFSDNFWNKLDEMMKRAAGERESLGWYQIKDFKLDKSRTNERIAGFPEDGDIVLVLSLDGSAEIKLNSANSDAFDLEVYERITHPFEDLYLTNTAQPGKTLRLLIGRGDWSFIKTIPEIDLSGTIRNDYLEQITDPLKIAQIIEDGHIKEHADIACEKILISGTKRLDQWRSTEDYTYMAPGMILLHATAKLSDWQHPSGMTYIHGGQIYTESIETDSLAALSITTAKLAALAITAAKIAAGAVTAEKINVTQLSAIAANVGILTAGIIKSTDAKTLFDLTNGYMSVSDGVYTRFKAGKLNGDYGTEIRDADGNLTVDMGKVVGGVDYAVASASNSISTSSASFVDMPNMSITKTLPKCIVFLMAKVWADVPSVDLRIPFTVDGNPVGQESGAASGKHYPVNLWTKSLAAGSHTFKIQWCTTGGAETVYSEDRILIVQWWYVI